MPNSAEVPTPAPTLDGTTPARYPAGVLHRQLLERALSERARTEFIGSQALFCPFYVKLEGRVGNDWGVVLNPASSRFGVLTFEHDDCGCPPSPDEEPDGSGRHDGEEPPEHLL